MTTIHRLFNNAIFKSVIFKIGIIIILAEVAVLTMVGFIYIDRFSDQVDRRIGAQVQIPGKLMQAGLLSYNSVENRETISQLVGEEIIEALVVGVRNKVFFSSDSDDLGQDVAVIPDVNVALFDINNPSDEVVFEGENVVAISPIFGPDGETVRMFLYIQAGTGEAEAEKDAMVQLFILGSAATVILTSVIIILSFSFTVLARIAQVLVVLGRVESGDLTTRATGTISEDEIGLLQRGVNSMVAQLEELVNDLEQRVFERTHRLEIVAALGERLTAILNPDELLVELISQAQESFDYYFVGIWLMDDERENLVVRAATGEISADMKAYGDILRLDAAPSLIARAARTGEIVSVGDVHQNPDWLRQHGLPDTRSEIAVPIIVEEEVVGVLDVQSDQVAGLDEGDASLLRSLSNQVAVALTNAQLFEQTKQAKEAAEKAQRAAEAANRAKSDFLANMSHELRTPLNAILGFTQLMHRDPTFTPAQRNNVRIIQQSGEHLLELINDVLAISKIEAGRATFTETDFDLHQLLATLESMFRAQSKGLQLHLECAPRVPQYIRTDERKLRQVLINLLNNAVKFTKEGGVTLRVEMQPGGKETREQGEEDLATDLPIPESEAGSTCLHFEIEDTGVGIAPEEMDQLFKVFTQTTSGQEVLEGTGLGLALSQRFVQLLGGDITVSSKVGEGSLFQFDIQVALPADGSEIEEHKAKSQERVVGLAPEHQAADGAPYRILVVEDREVSRVLLVQLLAAVGFEVRVAANGREAVAVCKAWKPHLIWMDMRMPVMDGYEATKRIKAQAQARVGSWPAPVIIALTAHGFEEERGAILAAGCDDLVRKPFRETEIFDKMAQHLDLRYVYQDLAPDESDGDVQAQVDLTPSDLADLPTDWAAELHHAAARGRAKRIRDLIEQIWPDHAHVAEVLAAWVHDFRFDRIMSLIEPLAEQLTGQGEQR